MYSRRTNHINTVHWKQILKNFICFELYICKIQSKPSICQYIWESSSLFSFLMNYLEKCTLGDNAVRWTVYLSEKGYWQAREKRNLNPLSHIIQDVLHDVPHLLLSCSPSHSHARDFLFLTRPSSFLPGCICCSLFGMFFSSSLNSWMPLKL